MQIYFLQFLPFNFYNIIIKESIQCFIFVKGNVFLSRICICLFDNTTIYWVIKFSNDLLI